MFFLKKKFWRSSRLHLNNFSNIMREIKLKITALKEKKYSFILPITPFSKPALLQCQEGTSARKRSPHQERKNGLSGISGCCTRVLLWFHPTQTSRAVVYRDIWEQEKSKYCQRQLLQLPVTCSVGKASRFHAKETCRFCRTPQLFTGFVPQAFMFTDNRCLCPFLLFPSCPQHNMG